MKNFAPALKRTCAALFLATTTAFLGGCAERFGAKSQNILLETDPPEAMINLDGKFAGKTPAVIFVPIKNSRREVNEKLQLLKEGVISQDEFNDFKNLSHRITIVKEGFETVQLEIKAEPFHKDAPNKGLCIFDIIYSPIFLFTPLAADLGNGACNGFQKRHFIKLRGKDDGGISIGRGGFRKLGTGLGR